MKKIFSTVVLVFCLLFISCENDENSNNTEFSTFEIRAKNTDDSPAINVKIILSYQSENGGQNLIDFGCTDSNGMVTATVPTNQIFILRAYDDSNVLILEQIVPYQSVLGHSLNIIVPTID